MKALSLAGLALLASGYTPQLALAADAAPVSAPTLKVGDSWTFDETTERGPSGFSRQRISETVERLNSDSMVVGVKVADAPTAPQDHIVGLDWGLKLLVDGEEKTTARPLSFPLHVGESWTSDWIDPRRQGNQLKGHFRKTYKVVGWEDVTVPGGAFHAIKIEENGMADTEVIIPSVAQSTAVGGGGSATAISHAQAGGRGTLQRKTYSVIWYAPEIKHTIKIVQEQYNGSEVMVERQTEELVSFKPAG